MNFETLVNLLYNHRPRNISHRVNAQTHAYIEAIGELSGMLDCSCGLTFMEARRWARHVAEEVKLLEQEEK